MIEVAVAAIIVVVALGALLGLLAVGSRATTVTRLRQSETSLAREITENIRNLPYNQLIASTLASSLQPLIPGSTVSRSGVALNVTRTPTALATPYTLRATFTACSLDDPSDGYGNHSADPSSGGTWCPDVAASGTTDTNPDDYKRVSVVVTPSRTRTTPKVQETVLVYSRPVNGPAVTCLTTSSCPGVNQTITTGSSLGFSVTTSTTAAAIQWLVNGSPPTSGAIPVGASDPYVPTSTTSTFTWNFPIPDGTYTIAARSFDSGGNAGAESKLQITLNRHQVIAPAVTYAGWNPLLGTNGGVDIAWVPSIDQDVLYYNVYHKYGASGAAILACSHVTGTSCSDQSATSPNPPSIPTCTNPPQSYTTQDLYWVVGVDTDPSGQLRESTAQSPSVDANLCNHQPNAPTGLTGTVSADGVTLNWTPPSPADPDAGDSIQAYRIYRWSTTGSWSDPGARLDLVGAVDGSGNQVTSYADNSPDPGGAQQNYCVTAVDSQQAESPCSNTVTG